MSLTIWSGDILQLAPCTVPLASYRIFLHVRVLHARFACFGHASCGTGFHHGNPFQISHMFTEIARALCLCACNMHHAACACSFCVHAQTQMWRVQAGCEGRTGKGWFEMMPGRLQSKMASIDAACPQEIVAHKLREYCAQCLRLEDHF